MLNQSNNHLQLELNFFENERGRDVACRVSTVRRIVSERTRDSIGQFATDLVAANDKIERISMERDIYRNNYLTVSKQLIELQHKTTIK